MSTIWDDTTQTSKHFYFVIFWFLVELPPLPIKKNTTPYNTNDRRTNKPNTSGSPQRPPDTAHGSC